MKPFKFSLQSLMDVKQNVEAQQKLQIKMIEKHIAQTEEEMAELREKREKHRQMYETDLQSGMMAEKLEEYGRFFALLNVTESILQERLASANREKQQYMSARLETRRDIKALEKLVEIEREAYQKKANEEMDNSIGDIITYKVAMK